VSDEPPREEASEGGAVRSGDRSATGPESSASLTQRTLDVLVFGPAGMVLTAVEDLPEFAAKSRRWLVTHIRNARTVGEFVVNRGHRELMRRMAADLDELARPPAAPEPTGAPRPDLGPASTTVHTCRPAGAVPQAPSPAGPADTAGPSTTGAPEAARPPAPATSGAPPVPEGAVDLAIPDYEALSASQVVRRLDGLGPGELEAVYRHEAATRRRRTILHRAQQLLGTEGTPGVPDPTA